MTTTCNHHSRATNTEPDFMNISPNPNWTLTRAAAGTGKTVHLVKSYLSLIFHGIPVEKIVAITFTRKAAAELIERVSNVLYAYLDDGSPQCKKAKDSLGGEQELYTPLLPQGGDQEGGHSLAKQALAGIGAAPIGTVDSFIQKLLSEFALYAALPLGPAGDHGGNSEDTPVETVPIDFPLSTSGDPAPYFNDAVREVLVSSSDGTLPDHSRELLKYYDIATLTEFLSCPHHLQPLKPATFKQVYRLLAQQTAEHLQTIAHEQGQTITELFQDSFKLNDGDWTEALKKPFKNNVTLDVTDLITWLQNGAHPEQAPIHLLALDYALHGRKRGTIKFRKQTKYADNPLRFYFKVGNAKITFSLAEMSKTVQRWQLEPEQEEQAEKIRRQLDQLRRQVTRKALAGAAAAGELGYDQLLRAATHLCGQKPNGLEDRFAALLVDEVQDSSAGQLDFYLALASTNPKMKCFFVGDSRQSIYLFRNADPSGLDRLGEVCGGDNEPLETNYRSTPPLVEAQKQLFSPDLNNRMEQVLRNGLESLEGIEANKAKGTLDPTDKPVLLLYPGDDIKLKSGQVQQYALECFAEKMKEVWREAEQNNKPMPTATVLTSTWKDAEDAKNVLRTLLKEESKEMGSPVAFLDGGGKWLSGRLASDVAIILKAISSPGDDVAWLGLWKHPMVGLTDQALALVSGGQGVSSSQTGDGQANESAAEENQTAPGWMNTLGWLHKADALLSPPHSPEDAAAFKRAVQPIRDAVANLPLYGCSRTIELLAGALGWRELQMVTPDDDSLYHFEAILEWLREQDVEGIPVEQIIGTILDDHQTQSADLPRLEVHRPEKHISCTTIFQAKGLQYDHVCYPAAGEGNKSTGSRSGGNEMVVEINGERLLLSGVNYPFDGGLKPGGDSIAALCSQIRSIQTKEEHLRLAYVAVTRAKTSVVMALRSKPSDKNNKKLYKLMQDGWAPPQTDDLDGQPEHNPLSRIQYKFHQEPDSLDQLPSGHVTVSDQAGASLHVPDYQGITQWQQASPSTVAGSLHKKRKAELAEQIKASAIRREGGFIPPAYKLVESPQGQVWKDLRPSWWGTLIHGWFEQWRFIGQPSKEAITDYLKEHMEGDSSPAADFLYTISTRLMENREHPLWKVVTAPGARLHFERPFVGLGHLPSGGEGAGQGSTHGTGVTPGTQQYLVTGSMDLLVENPDGTWQVIDFKAGNKSPDQETSIITDAHLRTYGPQMEAYRTMVNQALAANTPPTTTPPRVSQVSLWFVRTGASLSW